MIWGLWLTSSIAIANPTPITPSPSTSQGAWIAQMSAIAPPQIIYPPANHTTSAGSIFFIGTASQGVSVNGEPIRQSSGGHFAPSFPLAFGLNTFVFETGGSVLERTVTRLSPVQPVPRGHAEISSVSPELETWVQPGEPVCFSALGTPEAEVSLSLWQETVRLAEVPAQVLPAAASDLLVAQDQPLAIAQPGRYQTCVTIPERYRGQRTTPSLSLVWNGQRTTTDLAPLEVMARQPLLMAVAKDDFSISRIGPSSDYIRLSPWPAGVRSTITGRQNGWLRTASEQWIAVDQANIETVPTPLSSVIRNVSVTTEGEWTVLRVPLTEQLPYRVQQEPGQVWLDLDHASLQTDFLRLDINDPLVKTLTWAQTSPDRVRFTFHLESDYVWGYTADYENTTLVLRLRQQPTINQARPLEDLVIVLDPGHGGANDSGALGPNGLAEKDLIVLLAEQLRTTLSQAGAIVHLSRDRDQEVSLQARAQIQRSLEPHLFLSLHYNALPDAGQPETTSGIGSFWYHPHSRPLAQTLQESLPARLDQDSYGEFFASFFVIRETLSPAVLLELGFMTNPWEFEQISQAQHQTATAEAITVTLSEYLQSL